MGRLEAFPSGSQAGWVSGAPLLGHLWRTCSVCVGRLSLHLRAGFKTNEPLGIGLTVLGLWEGEFGQKLTACFQLPYPSQVTLSHWTFFESGSVLGGGEAVHVCGVAGTVPFPGWELLVGTWEGALATAPGCLLSNFSGADLGPSGEVRGVSLLPPGPGCVGWGEAAVHLLSGLIWEHIWGPGQKPASSHFCLSWCPLCRDRSCRCPEWSGPEGKWFGSPFPCCLESGGFIVMKWLGRGLVSGLGRPCSLVCVCVYWEWGG